MPSSRFVGGGAKRGGRPEPPAWEPKRPKAANKGPSGGVQFITLAEDAPFVAAGLPELGPIVVHTTEGTVANCIWAVHSIMEAMSVTEESITLTDDADWSQYPEIGEQVKQATGQELSITIAECAEAGIWAVGCGGKKKQRDNAARLALCVGLAANMDDVTELATAQPEFAMLCESAGVSTGVDVKQVAAQKQEAWKPTKSAKSGAGGGKGGGKAKGGGKGDSHRDVPLWINIAEGEEAIPEVIEAMSPEAFAVSSDGGRRALYGKIDAALAYFIGDNAGEEVEYLDDAQRKDFPAVASAVQRCTHREEGQCLAVCAAAGVWAVGTGNKVKTRKDAAKVALAATMALQHIELGQEIEYSDFPGLEKFVEEAQEAQAGKQAEAAGA